MFCYGRFCILKKACNIYILMLELTFPREDVTDWKRGGHYIYIWKRVLISGNGGNGWQFFLRIGTVLPPTIRLGRVPSKMQITSLKNCLSTFNFFRLAFIIFFCAFCQKIEPSWRQFEPETNVEQKFANMYLIFYQHLY